MAKVLLRVDIRLCDMYMLNSHLGVIARIVLTFSFFLPYTHFFNMTAWLIWICKFMFLILLVWFLFALLRVVWLMLHEQIWLHVYKLSFNIKRNNLMLQSIKYTFFLRELKFYVMRHTVYFKCICFILSSENN